MHFIFFLHSFFLNTDVRRVFGKHRLMKQVKHISSFYNYTMIPTTPTTAANLGITLDVGGAGGNNNGKNSNNVMPHLSYLTSDAIRSNRGYSIQSAISYTGQGGGDYLDSPQPPPDSPTADSIQTATTHYNYNPNNRMFMIQQMPNPSYTHRLSLYDRDPRAASSDELSKSKIRYINKDKDNYKDRDRDNYKQDKKGKNKDKDKEKEKEKEKKEKKEKEKENNMKNNKIGNEEVSVIYTEKDPIKLFRMPIDRNAGPGFRVIIPKKLQKKFYDPINGNPRLSTIQVRKIFNSNAKPYLIDCFVTASSRNNYNNYNNYSHRTGDSFSHTTNATNTTNTTTAYGNAMLSSSFILKQGDDLRKDAAVLQCFRFMNRIWKEANLNYNGIIIEALPYKCISLGPDFGIIELVNDCIELNKISTIANKFDTLKKENKFGEINKFRSKLIATAAGSYIAAFIMGIRDRHDDNILINIRNGTLFHIDFGYMLGDKVTIDTSKFAITKSLKNIMGKEWQSFVNIACDAYWIIRIKNQSLIDYARVCFSLLYPVNEIEIFIRQALKLEDSNGIIVTDENAKKYIENALSKAPDQLKTKIKNVVHGIAVRIKT